MSTGLDIAMVSEHASPLATIGGVDAGGQNVHVAALATALARRGHRVTVYTRRDATSLPDRVELAPGVVVEHVTAGPPTDVPKDALLPYMREFAMHLADRWSAQRPDVVHAHFWMSGFASVLAARDAGVPVVQTFHALGTVKRRHQGGQDTSPPQRLRMERAVAHDAAAIVATCTDEVVELGRMGVRRGKVSVVPCGVDVSHFTPEGPAEQRPAQRHRIAVVGRLVQRKGVDDVIRALGLVPGTELLVVGGPDAEFLDVDPEVQRLRAVATSCGVADRVVFRGRVSRADLPALLRSLDLLVAVPWYEPFGLVPLEAMACGVPVVASEVGGLQDTVAERVTGELVPPRRPDVLAHRLRTLLGDPITREGFGLAGVDRARARYAWERVAADTETVYLRVLVAADADGPGGAGAGSRDARAADARPADAEVAS